MEISNAFLHFYPVYPNLVNQTIINSIYSRYITTNQTQSTYYPFLDRIGSDFGLICQSFEMAEFYSRLKLNVYMYEYAFRIPTTIYPETMGVVHTDELPTVFAEQLSNKVKKNMILLLEKYH